MSNDETATIGPLLAARTRIDEAIQAYLDKAAILRKRREMLTAAIDLIRLGDDEIMNLPTVIKSSVQARKTTKRLTQQEVQTLENTVLDILRTRGGCEGLRQPVILQQLIAEGVVVTPHALRQVLGTCPGITKQGERDQTTYSFYYVGPKVKGVD